MKIEDRILDCLMKAGGADDLSELLKKFPPGTQSIAELKAMTLVKKGTLSLKKSGGTYQLTVLNPAQASHENQNKSRTIAEHGSLVEVCTAVVTLPLSLQTLGNRSSILTSEEAFGDLLSSSEEYVKLCLPFPEEAVFVHFCSLIKKLAAKSVRIYLLTRDVRHNFRAEAGSLAAVKSISRLWDIYATSGNPALVEVRDYHHGLGSDNSRFHYESTHAKIVISDGRMAYSGSAEFRLNSLFNNFETGFLVRGSPAASLEQTFDIVWANAVPVTRSYVRNYTRR